ncbi:hypothetical protein BO86DRAFT_440679 [Aspergillus japonicus CBS 114.51]|uniref:Uncharacterized protein n=1 Tax=Aspergillus japonicus CBS 114.51 TaxID=1448312 RepID=A0A8T8WPH8_ASPJA|nr:hypothetical protein BO86DRAFT_440679 [Aspergillus japonicus CBS 114.51]RAH77594.1 hypothetical protein BO86DRAFT_440679 [Aspergillus japonicus CBS 114.51]
MTKIRRRLHHPAKGFLRPRIRRVYLYSRTDEMVPWDEVLDHISEAGVATDGERRFGSDGGVYR